MRIPQLLNLFFFPLFPHNSHFFLNFFVGSRRFPHEIIPYFCFDTQIEMTRTECLILRGSIKEKLALESKGGALHRGLTVFSVPIQPLRLLYRQQLSAHSFEYLFFFHSDSLKYFSLFFLFAHCNCNAIKSYKNACATGYIPS